MGNDVLDANLSFLKAIFMDNALIKIAALILGAVSLVFLLVAIYKKYKRGWKSLYFILLCCTVCLWAIFTFLEFTVGDSVGKSLWNALRMSSSAFVSVFVYLHVRKQVSYKLVSMNFLVAILAVPVIFTVIMVQGAAGVDIRSEVFDAIYNTIALIITYGFNIVMLILAYLQCFNVMYQMPKRMRKSTHYLIVGVTALTIYYCIDMILGSSILAVSISDIAELLFRPLIAPIALIVTLSTFFGAFKTAPADNVIVTSREFVLDSLSTIILVLSKAKRILDWNMKSDSRRGLFPDPMYKETYEDYRKRMIESTGARVSQNNDDIITIAKDDVEFHYMVTVHDISHKKRIYGYLVEIFEVTNVFDTIRTLSESAFIDQLTGLHNRNAYIKNVETLTTESNMPLAVMVGDVNNLKQINDVWGHLSGDEILKNVAGIINMYKPNGAFASRIGGDEYVVLVPNGDISEAKTFIYKVNEACKAIPEEEYGVPSISWGYAVMCSADENYNDVFAMADSMMYKDKKARFRFRASGLVPTEEFGRNKSRTAVGGYNDPETGGEDAKDLINKRDENTENTPDHRGKTDIDIWGMADGEDKRDKGKDFHKGENIYGDNNKIIDESGKKQQVMSIITKAGTTDFSKKVPEDNRDIDDIKKVKEGYGIKEGNAAVATEAEPKREVERTDIDVEALNYEITEDNEVIILTDVNKIKYKSVGSRCNRKKRK